MKNLFRIVEIDTSKGVGQNDQRQTAEQVASKVLDSIKSAFEEKILSLPKPDIKGVFTDRLTASADEAAKLMKMFHKSGTFEPRNSVESNNERVQALPICVVRNASGHALRLKRREKKVDNPLHEKIVIWAGGHVRREDSTLGDAIPQCVIRELEEELN